jgi:peptide/nickel transport system substrate-binding protein
MTRAGLKPQPLLAKSWESTKSGRLWRFTLRENVVSNFGNKLQAGNVRYGFEKSLAAKRIGAFLLNLCGVFDPKQVQTVKGKPNEVDFRLASASPLFLLTLGTNWGFTFDLQEISKHITASDPYGQQWLRTNIASYGPYEIESFEPGGALVKLRARSNYWGEKPIRQVVQSGVTDQSQRFQLLLTGQVDYAETLSLTQAEQAKNNPNLKVETTNGTTGAFLCLTRKSPWDDIRLRQALAKAIPYEDLVKTVYRGFGKQWKSTLAPWVQGYTEKYGYKYDPGAAKAALARIAPVSIKFSYSDASVTAEPILILLQTAFKDVGVNISLDKQPNATFEVNITTRQIDTFVDTLHTPLHPLPAYYFPLYYGKGGLFNWTGYENETIEAAIKAIPKQRTLPALLKLVEDAQRIVMRDLPIMPMVWSGTTIVHNKNLALPKVHNGNGTIHYQDFRWIS